MAQKKDLALLLFFITLLTPSHLVSGLRNSFFVWNVGQGQWVTYREDFFCLHFDMGGESSPIEQVSLSCAQRPSILALSHWDLDHLSFHFSIIRNWPHSCLWSYPPGEPAHGRALALRRWPLCSIELRTLLTQRGLQFFLTPSLKQKTSNANSQIFYFRSWLFPGDSPKAMEKIWSFRTSKLGVRHLMLGHHGSRTSTSPDLLHRHPHLVQAVASSRFKRYGHPHPETRLRLWHFGVAMLRTEDWGHLVFQD